MKGNGISPKGSLKGRNPRLFWAGKYGKINVLKPCPAAGKPALEDGPDGKSAKIVLFGLWGWT